MSDLYRDEVLVERKVSAMAGPGTETTSLSKLASDYKNKLLQAFANDIDIQQIIVVSTNYGFVRQYTKQFMDANNE